MPKCAAYWRAKDAGKECGVPKPGKMSRILQDAYQYGVVPDLVAMGLNENDIYECLLYTNCCLTYGSGCVSLVRLKRDSPIRKLLLDEFFKDIAAGKRVTIDTYKTIERTHPEINVRNWEPMDFLRHYGALRRDRKMRGINIESGKKKLETVRQPVIFRDGERSSLMATCTPGQISILQQMVSKGFGEDEYSAFCIALKWASERISSEVKKND